MYMDKFSTTVEPLEVAEPDDGPLLFETQLDQFDKFPKIRFMGSKHRLIPWLSAILGSCEFDSVLDAFSGSGAVAYYMKCAGKRVIANDFLEFTHRIANATIENSVERLQDRDVDILTDDSGPGPDFIQKTFDQIFYTPEDLKFLDIVSGNLAKLANDYKRSLALSALTRSCLKRQPRGVFTVRSWHNKYDDGRRDLRLSLEDHFREQVSVYNSTVFGNGRENRALRTDVFDIDLDDLPAIDLVYLDPPYVPRSDDNDYIKRYHFVEGLSQYWKGLEIQQSSKVHKIPKRFTPFSYRRTAIDAFRSMFRKFSDSIIALSYSSNGYPDLKTLVGLMGEVKADIQIYKRQHRYHFGTHASVRRSVVDEFLILGK